MGKENRIRILTDVNPLNGVKSFVRSELATSDEFIDRARHKENRDVIQGGEGCRPAGQMS